ncbi:MAG TPA: hypothetical protein VN689_00515 [Burkholderiales bacterium]|nr:hypothetical protein [Burkholderiales bacterium]
MSAKFFPLSQYHEAHRYAVEVARSFDGRFEVGIERCKEYTTQGYRAGFILPKPENRQGLELRCETVKASDPL